MRVVPGANADTSNRVGGSGIAPVQAGIPISFRPNGYVCNQSSQMTRPYICKYGPIPKGEGTSEELRRRLDDIESGRVKVTVYPSAEEYIRHLDAMLDG